jgi:hypothetical protein
VASTAIVAPAPAPVVSAAVMRFNEDQGVAIKAAPRPPPPSPAWAALAAPAAPVETAKKRALTLEQQLADAQLKASMR